MHWAGNREGEQVTGLVRRMTPVRQLTKYMNRLGLETYVLPRGLPGKRIRYVPHIFTDQELRAFFAATDRCPISPRCPGRYLVIPVFFRVLYCCGLRLSEARRLKVDDVDLGTGNLVIRQSKGNQDRTVMMSEAVRDLCRVYHSKVSCISPNRLGFFPNRDGQLYGRREIDAWFRLFWDRTGIANSCGRHPASTIRAADIPSR